MISRRTSLAEVAAIVAAQLEKSGIPVAVVGGSAVTMYAPQVYTSKDIDFAAIRGTNRRAFAVVLKPLGFTARGRDFVHPRSRYTVDLVADTPYIDQRPITRFATITTAFGPVRVYRFEDAIADRIAAFLHWGDSQSLDVAERAVAMRPASTRWPHIERALRQLDASLPDSAGRLDIAMSRLRAAFSAKKVSHK